MKEISDLIQKIFDAVKNDDKVKSKINECNYNPLRWLDSLNYTIMRKTSVPKQVGCTKFIDKATYDVLIAIKDLYPDNEVSKRLKTFIEGSVVANNYLNKVLYPTVTDLNFIILQFGITDKNQINARFLSIDQIKEDLIKLYEYITEDKHKKLDYNKFILSLIIQIQYFCGEREETDSLDSCKPGKFLTKIFPDIKASEIGNFVDYLNALLLKKEENSAIDFNIVSGLDICYYYNEDNYVKKPKVLSLKKFNNKGSGSDPAPDTLNKSCMRYKEKGLDIEFYSKFPDQIKLAILTEDNKLRARCILWYADDGNKYYDRVYYVKTSDYDQLVNTLRKEGYRNCSCSNREKYNYVVEITISKSKYENITKCPYLDTLNYFILGKEPDDLIILNNDAVAERRNQINHIYTVGHPIDKSNKAAASLTKYKRQYCLNNINSLKLDINSNNINIQDLVYNKTLNKLDTIDNCTYNSYLGYYISRTINKDKHILNVHEKQTIDKKVQDAYYYMLKYFRGYEEKDIPLRDKKKQTELVYSTLYGYKIFKHRAVFVPKLNSYIYQQSCEHTTALQKIKNNNV